MKSIFILVIQLQNSVIFDFPVPIPFPPYQLSIAKSWLFINLMFHILIYFF
jgi:hypothetical protein